MIESREIDLEVSDLLEEDKIDVKVFWGLI